MVKVARLKSPVECFRKIRPLLLTMTMMCCMNSAKAIAQTSQGDVEKKVETLLGRMTLDEKIYLVAGYKDQMHVQGVARLGIPELKFSDGPVGVRCWGQSTAYPAGAMLASTWDVDLAKQVGVALGRDSRARGVHVLLGPGVDLYRVAQCGRNFEYFGEDPYLSAEITKSWILGLQSKGVAASVKHFAANDQETLRDSVDTIVDERRLHEICFPPFKAAVKEANSWTVMAAYNKVNGDWCTANRYLLTDVLSNDWGFKGVLMSDWGAVHEFLKPFTNGTDLEMGERIHYTQKNIKSNLTEAHSITQEQLDDHVRRILRMSVGLGFTDRSQEDKSIPLDDPASAATSLQVAREGLVLLKNDESLLPLNRSKSHAIVVVGPNACPAVIGGGGSSQSEPFTSTSLLDAIAESAGKSVKVSYIPNWLGKDPTSESAFMMWPMFEPLEDGQRGMKTEYFRNAGLSGSPAATKTERSTNFQWGKWHPDEVSAGPFSMRYSGRINIRFSDDYVFSYASDGAKVFLDGKPLFANSSESSQGPKSTESSKSNDGLKTGSITKRLMGGSTHDILIEYRHESGDAATMRFTWGRAHEAFSPEERSALSDADAIVASVGFNANSESEGRDRTYDLAPEQANLINKVGAINPKTVVTINSGGNVGMSPWINSARAIFHSWYPGQQGNRAVGEALFGDLNPSGRLPDTFEKVWADSPAYENYPGTSENGGRVEYKEGIYVGYRWFDKKNLEPRFPFGFGLSYTKFSIDDMKVTGTGTNLSVTANVRNVGERSGAEVVQLYVRPVNPKVD